MRVFYVMCILLLSAAGAKAQQTYQMPKQGDVVPDLEMSKIIFSDQTSAKISDFKDQLLILDFWSTGCSGCVAALPKMESLQKSFGPKIKIMPVTGDKESTVRSFWKVNKYTKNLTLPSVVEDKILKNHFKWIAIPHEVWIYKEKVVAITDGQYVDDKNIQKVLNGEPINWPVKNDFYVFDPQKEMLFNTDPNQINNGTAFKYAAIAGYKEGASQGIGIVRNKAKKNNRTYSLNNSIYNTYLNFWSKVIDLAKLLTPDYDYSSAVNRPIWEVADKFRYRYEEGNPTYGYYESWMRDNAICFESMDIDTGQTDKEIYKKAISDLNALLGLNVRWEKRKEKVLLLVRTNQVDKLKTKTNVETVGQYDENVNVIWKGSELKLRNASLNYLIGKLNADIANPYVYNETGYKNNVDMDLNIPSWTNIPAIRKVLQPYGLDLKEEERMVDRFVFSEVDGGMLLDTKMMTEAKAKKEAQSVMKGPSAEENNAFLGINKTKPDVISLPSGLQYKILKKGTGPKVNLTDKISVHYTGTLTNGKIFDSSYEKGKPLVLKLTDMLKGWQEGVPLMPVGSKFILYIPSELAYKERTGSGAVPPNSVLIFEIELLGLVK